MKSPPEAKDFIVFPFTVAPSFPNSFELLIRAKYMFRLSINAFDFAPPVSRSLLTGIDTSVHGPFGNVPKPYVI